MARYALVGSHRLLSRMLYQYGLGVAIQNLGLMLLAQEIVCGTQSVEDTLELVTDYRNLMVASRKKPLVILDNGAAELGRSIQIDSLLRAVDLIDPDYVILPDAVYNPDLTLQLAKEAKDEFQSHFAGSYFLATAHKPTLVGVVRGPAQELVNMTGYYKELGLTTVALPRNCGVEAFDEVKHSRLFGVDAILHYYPEFGIHLLGLTKSNVKDDLTACQLHPSVLSIDTAIPVRLGLEGTDIRPKFKHTALNPDLTGNNRRKDYLRYEPDQAKELPKEVWSNVEGFSKYCQCLFD